MRNQEVALVLVVAKRVLTMRLRWMEHQPAPHMRILNGN